jgi:hypothetical protein
MLTKVLHPICTELSRMDRDELGRLLGLGKKELGSRLQGDTQFTVPELMSVAQWLGRPASVFFARFECLLGRGNHFDERLP